MLPRIVLFFACAAALDVDEFLPPEQTVTLTHTAALGANDETL